MGAHWRGTTGRKTKAFGAKRGVEVLALARAKAKEKEKEKQEATARFQERAAKKRRMIVESVTMGNTLLARIAEQGDAAIARMVVPELQMLIRHSDPGAPPLKGNKASFLERARRLSTVKEALATFEVNLLETVPSSATSEPALSADVAAPAPLMPPHALATGEKTYLSQHSLTIHGLGVDNDPITRPQVAGGDHK